MKDSVDGPLGHFPWAFFSNLRGGSNMDVKQMARIIQQRLGLEDQEFALIQENPKFQRLFENVSKGVRYQLVAEVVESKGCQL